MKNNKVYVNRNAISQHEDFDVWYADGDPFLSFKGAWTRENDKVRIFGRMGGEMGCIKPDAKALTYYLKLERWEYVLHTRRIYEDYYVNGMKWQINGSFKKLPLDFLLEDSLDKDVHVRLATFKDKGDCIEIKAKDVEKLRIAVAAVIAIGIKEEYCGLSEGLRNPDASKLQKAKNWFFAGRGKTYEQLLKEEETA